MNTDHIPQATTRNRSFYSGSTTAHESYTDEELELLRAIQEYKREQRRPWPTWSEILAIAKSLGWRKVAERGPLPVVDNRFSKGREV